MADVFQMTPVQMVLVTLFFAVATAISKRFTRSDGPPRVFVGFWEDVWRSLTGWNGLYWVTGVAVTAVFVVTGWDRSLQDFFQAHTFVTRSVAWFMLIAGNFWTLAIALIVLVVALVRKNPLLRGAGVAGLRAVLATYFVTTLLKGLSGRRGPAHEGFDALHAHFPKTDNAADFAFDFWHHSFSDGRFFWPSGHTSSAMTLASALVAYYPEKRWLPWLVYPLVAYTGLTMIEGDFHWVSDVIAGALIGHVIGWTAGKSVRARVAPASGACSDG